MIKIRNLVDREYTTASVLEDTRDILEWLRHKDYLAIMDESGQIIGIITIKDLLRHPDSRNVVDCFFKKPSVCQEQTVIEVFSIMNETGNDILPVYERATFIGVISLMKITYGLIGIITKNPIFLK